MKPADKARETKRAKSDAMTRHLLEIEKHLGRRITPVELRSELFRASRDVYVCLTAERKSHEAQSSQ